LSNTTAQHHLIQGQTVFNDSSIDQLSGQTGSDVFYAGSADVITDLTSSNRAFIASGA